jgi:hypothetical protein
MLMPGDCLRRKPLRRACQATRVLRHLRPRPLDLAFT